MEEIKLGRPLKYSTAKELQDAIDQYFKDGAPKRIIKTGKGNNIQAVEISVPTMTGIALYLGFLDRQSMHDYEKRGEFRDVIKNARARVEQSYEENLQTPAPAGSIFALKNFGWHDTQDLNVSQRSTVPVPIADMGLLNEPGNIPNQLEAESTDPSDQI